MTEPRGNRRTDAPEDTVAKVNRQAGQWTILLWGISLLSGVIVAFVGLSYQGQKDTMAAIVDLDKTVSVFIAGDKLRDESVEKSLKKIGKIAAYLTERDRLIDPRFERIEKNLVHYDESDSILVSE